MFQRANNKLTRQALLWGAKKPEGQIRSFLKENMSAVLSYFNHTETHSLLQLNP